MHPLFTGDIATQRREDLVRASERARIATAVHETTGKNARRPEAWDRGFVMVSPRQASELLVGEVTAGRARLAIGLEHPAHVVSSGLPAVFYPATWTRALVHAGAHVELRPASSYSTEVLLRLEAPRGFGWLPGAKQRLARVARALSDELRSTMTAAARRDAAHDRDRVAGRGLYGKSSPRLGTPTTRPLRKPSVRSDRR